MTQPIELGLAVIGIAEQLTPRLRRASDQSQNDVYVGTVLLPHGDLRVRAYVKLFPPRDRGQLVYNEVIAHHFLIPGDAHVAYTKDRAGLLGSVLASASALLRAGSSSVVERLTVVDAQIFSQEVMNEVTRLNPFLGDRIFHHQLNMDNGEVLELPILGDKIFGAPISFAARDHRMRAEAYVAKFNWARKRVSQQPRVYVRAPVQGPIEVAERLERSVRELTAIAEASRVPVRICESTEELASAIVRDEAA